MRSLLFGGLYYDAYGSARAKTLIQETNSDYIVIVKNLGLSQFNAPFIWDKKVYKATKYIYDNYKIVKSFSDKNGSIMIMKRNDLIKTN